MPTSASLSRRRKPRQTRSQVTYDALLTATARVLVKDGYEAASTNRIAQEAGVSVGSLYQYFSSKEGLVMAVMDHHRARSLARFEARAAELAGAPLRVALGALIGDVLAEKAADPRLHQALHELLPRMRQLGYVDSHELKLFRAVRAFLAPRATDIRPRDLDMAVFILVHSVNALAYAVTTERPEYLQGDAFVSELCSLVVGYLRPEPARPRPANRRRSSARRGEGDR
ncbi:TetR/AcrR family transcriptional regulator [Sorangium cellulosum]|uniref:TetR/AcrR family transcriptional regulator n=1 Tax=Sorangium cellulosum TaxID=56 RepID=UPI003D9A1520